MLEYLRGLVLSPELHAQGVPHTISVDSSLDEAKKQVKLIRIDAYLGSTISRRTGTDCAPLGRACDYRSDSGQYAARSFDAV